MWQRTIRARLTQIMRYRWKLLIAFECLLGLGLILVIWHWSEWFNLHWLDRERDSLKQMLVLLESQLDLQDPNLDSRVDGLASRLGRRITIVSADGKVLADSSFSGPALQSMENHSNRDEIRAALAHGYGYSLRFSTSLDTELLYVATTLADGSAVLRIATPVNSRKGWPAGPLSSTILLGAALGALAVLFVWMASRRLSSSIRTLEETVSRIGDQPDSNRIPLDSRSELGGLAQRLRKLSRSIHQRILQLESERNFLTAVLNGMREGVMVAGSDGRVREVNPAFLEIFGLSRSPSGQLPVEVVRNPEIQDGIQAILEDGRPRYREIEVGDKTLFAHFASARLEAGKRGVVVVFHDVSELRRLERVRKDFVANVSHELRTPLTSIQGYSETLLSEPNLAEVPTRFLKRIHDKAIHLSEVVDELLELSRIEGQRLTVKCETIQIQKLNEDLSLRYGPQAQAKGLEWRLEIDSNRDFLEASPAFLNRILQNLIENALKYTEKGIVGVRLRDHQNSVRFEVFDSGVGISETEQDRVFERFYRVGSAGQAHGGAGIGLSLVRHLVSLHGGRVWLKSQPGKGTSVFFELPQPTLERQESAGEAK